MQVLFHGVRGSMPITAATHQVYGGNTACVEVRCGSRVLFLDAGTGIYARTEKQEAQEMDILLSHTHIDHIMGLPFFPPLYCEHARIRIWAGHLQPESRLKDAISRLISPPLFPMRPADMKAAIEWMDFRAGETLGHAAFAVHGIEVSTILLHHPDRATGYRIAYQGRALCYLTDLEHTPGSVDPALADFVRGADLLIYDSTYDDEEFIRYQGWGHSTWQQAVRLANAGEVRQVAVFHHDPAADDKILDMRNARLQALRPGALVAREGLILSLEN